MKYFTLKELRAENESQFHNGFLKELCALREEFNLPMNPTSCARGKVYNKKIGGASKSLHIWDFPAYPELRQTGCMAIDIACLTDAYMDKLVEIAYKRGWSVGIDKKRHFVHLDRRVDLGLQKVKFLY